MNMNTFSVIGTPIGNLEDITLRALDTLKKADLILCEDTRVTNRLLEKYGIQARTMSYHTHSKLSRVQEIVNMLKDSSRKAGMNMALLSDAGTPAISDPGSELVRRIRSELSQEIMSGDFKIEAIPGPSALTAALSIAGVPCGEFVFLGFLPHKKGRQTLFKEIVESDRTVVFYESPHRILKTLESLKVLEIQSKNLKRVTICRELTKVFEEVVSGTAGEVYGFFSANPDKVRGEFVIIVSVG
jgi:16S rRNA (cytidine1402-2'-O)-methyltransferase